MLKPVEIASFELSTLVNTTFQQPFCFVLLPYGAIEVICFDCAFLFKNVPEVKKNSRTDFSRSMEMSTR